MNQLKTARGRPLPLGASRLPDGINFAILSRHATAATLCLFPPDTPLRPFAEIVLDPHMNRTGDHWHIRVIGLSEAFAYGWKIDGPSGLKHRFDPTCILIDPAATILSDSAAWGGVCEVDPKRTSRRALYVPGRNYDWEDDSPPLTPHEDSIVYELHVRGFTQHGSSGVANPGTFRGLMEKIPYLKWLGVTAVELLPIHEFDECDCPFTDPATGKRLRNYWGYGSIAFFAVKAAYAASGAESGQIEEFRDMVRAFHQAGIEVYLDVVFNHTGEGDDRGRTISLRGFDNELYYLLDENGNYLNFSGCGNTLNCNHPLVRALILQSLHFWVGDMHVDGFRFDLASILGRDRDGRIMIEPPIIEKIAEDGVLADTKLIAEPWDAAGAYQVGSFPFGRRWSEWNGRYRDDVRKFWRGVPGMTGALATRLGGSSDLYQWNGRLPRHSLNFLTAHDGFTLHDLTAYNEKHNEANGEDNRDGANDNESWNGGVEGPTEDPAILENRLRRAKGLAATLFLSQGIPMWTSGDEFLRTQQGNNNAWCQDNELSWINWNLTVPSRAFLRFVREMIQLRKRHPVFRRRRFYVGALVAAAPIDSPEPLFPPTGPVRPGETGFLGDARHCPVADFVEAADVRWHGLQPNQPDFGPDATTLAFTLDGRFTSREGTADYHPDNDFYIAMNVGPQSVMFQVPPSPTGRCWRQLIDTTLSSPEDFVAEGDGAHVASGSGVELGSFGLLVLISEK